MGNESGGVLVTSLARLPFPVRRRAKARCRGETSYNRGQEDSLTCVCRREGSGQVARRVMRLDDHTLLRVSALPPYVIELARVKLP